jgi:hypothetical protein
MYTLNRLIYGVNAYLCTVVRLLARGLGVKDYYIEYQSVCPVQSSELSAPTNSNASECCSPPVPKWGWGHIRLRGRVGRTYFRRRDRNSGTLWTVAHCQLLQQL